MIANWFSGSKRTILVLLTALATLLLPALGWAAGGENVHLEFTDGDKMYLYASLAFGFIALITAFVLRGQVMSRSQGDEKMQEVGAAIKAGALAYLRQQVSTMTVFVVILAVGLFFLYRGQNSVTVAMQIAVCFVLGVAASYIAGYVGMTMAVEANTRTAAAALSSYRQSLEIAFRAGGVAGLITVGMGLIGATAIFLAVPAEAMRLLVGFGFGGSLAALFMRVGGGIYTKAADVGADLVGKVEAGIPEDDPRNPAVIADNVGDNVGDCAGMAADVFESYEVTLVAAIVLGAATAAIFDTATWMKLVMFALMARGIGILASIVGIFSVKGEENINADPLKAIKKGFTSSAILATLLTAGAAWYMLGGMKADDRIQTTEFADQTTMQYRAVEAFVGAQSRLARETNKKPEEIAAADILKDPGYVAATPFFNENTRQQFTDIVASQPQPFDMSRINKPQPISGLQPVSFADAEIGNYATLDPTSMTSTEPVFKSLKEVYGAGNLVYKKVKSTMSAPGQQNPEPTTTIFGPTTDELFAKRVEELKTAGTTVEELGTFPALIYKNEAGDLFLGIEANVGEASVFELDPSAQFIYWPQTVEEVKAAGNEAFSPTAYKQASTLNVSHTPAHWWQFFVCILFGIIMAFAFEALTDYYVSFKKSPVKEVAGVATAGPAPMIIQGFAYGKESSVFSVFAIVICLIVPLLIFPTSQYGGYLLSFYGIALVGLGLLTTTGFILAMDTFGPISDNAQGVFEMSGAGHTNAEGARRVQLLDAAGNTTKALTKGFAIATAVVAAVALFHAYVDEAKLAEAGMRLEVPEIFLGMLVGGATPFLFAAFSINAVGRAAFQLIFEVRRQFQADAGIMAGTSKPDYGRCVAIVTAAAQKELLGPGIIAVAMPILVAFGFSIGKGTTMVGTESYNLVGAQALGGFLAGTILSGQLLAVTLANSGGMWDNAKKLIEDGLHGGKGTEEHKAAVVCDTVGDPFKDTAGPALNPLIKVMNLVALLLAPTIIQPYPTPVLVTVTLVAVGLLAFSIWNSKRTTVTGEMERIANEEKALEAASAPATPKKKITVEDDEA